MNPCGLGCTLRIEKDWCFVIKCAFPNWHRLMHSKSDEEECIFFYTVKRSV